MVKLQVWKGLDKLVDAEIETMAYIVDSTVLSIRVKQDDQTQV